MKFVPILFLLFCLQACFKQAAAPIEYHDEDYNVKSYKNNATENTDRMIEEEPQVISEHVEFGKSKPVEKTEEHVLREPESTKTTIKPESLVAEEEVVDEDIKHPEEPQISQKGAAVVLSETNILIMPAHGPIKGRFGEINPARNTKNDGIYIAAQEGSAVVAAAQGEVIVSQADNKLYGNFIIIKHDNDLYTAYAHLDHISVNKGQIVASGTKIGTVGSTGNAEEPELYFAVKKGKQAVDPMSYLE